MLSSQIKTGVTSRGIHGISPWNVSSQSYSLGQINLGNNFIAKIEIVSSLNSLNYARYMLHYGRGFCGLKYNPKVYMSAIQTVAYWWDYDTKQSPEAGIESGSWQKLIINNIFI